MMRDEFLKMLRCPLTRQPLAIADGALLAQLNAMIVRGALANRAGDPIDEPLEGGLIDPNKNWLYPVWGGIPSLVPDEAISLRENDPQQE
jgi:uncharacterized protein YbaR (Trm112 family)